MPSYRDADYPSTTDFNDMSEPYDPYIPGSNPNQPGGGPGPAASGSSGGGAKPSGGAGNNKTAAIQQQIDDTVGIMRENITKVAERGERLDALQDKTDNLAQSAQGFRRGANRVRKKMWWYVDGFPEEGYEDAPPYRCRHRRSRHHHRRPDRRQEIG